MVDKPVFEQESVHRIVIWSKTARGGRQTDMFADDEPLACSSAYGLCE